MNKFPATFAIVLLFALSSVAQTSQFQTKAGVVVPVPAGFHEAKRDSLLIVNAPFVKQAEAVFQRQEGAKVVSMMIYDIPVASTRAALAALPGESGALPQRNAEVVLADLLRAAPELRSDATAIGLQYDNARKASAVEIRATEVSLAHLMLAQPDSSSAWQGLAKQGDPIKIVRCMMNAIAQSVDKGNLQGSGDAAAKACDIPATDAINYVRYVGKNSFESRQTVARILQVITSKGASGVMFDTDESNLQLMEPAWQAVWAGIRVLPEAAAPRGITSRLSLANYSWWKLVTACIGAPVGALFFGLLLARLIAKRIKKTLLAALLGQATVLLLAMLIGHSAIVDGSITGLGLVYFIAAVVTFPVTYLLLRGLLAGTANPVNDGLGSP